MRSMRLFRRGIAATLTAFTTLAVTAACGNDLANDTAGSARHGNATSPAVGTSAATGDIGHNQADVTFAQTMMAHHQQAIEMANLGEAKASNPQVKALAVKIKSAQQREIEEMSNWLKDWGVPAPSAAAGHNMPGMSDSAMPGMMSEKDMTTLRAAKSADFDTMFLEMMIGHHKGAVEMATTHQQHGQRPGVKAFAESVKTDQGAEVQQMETLLGKP